MSKKFTIRVQSSEGTKRIDITPDETNHNIYAKVATVFSLPTSDSFILYKEQNKQTPINQSRTKSNLRHGDMIYLVAQRENLFRNENSIPIILKPQNGASNLDFLSDLIDITEDDVDLQLDKIDGRIPRQPNPLLCHHNKHGKCLYCIPVEPYDEEYLKAHSPPIKHMSFQAYTRKLRSLTYGDRNTLASLENISCSMKEKCSTGHPPWPKGVCTSYQPNPVTLMRQLYRHVDNIMFENGILVNRFLNYWRSSGHQRVGFLYGRYEVYDAVPLGVRAVVAAIYEPPQETSKNSVQLTLPDPHEVLVDKLANRLGLRCIGWIFTDLIPDDQRTGHGPVVHHRGNAGTCFLTAQECIMAGSLQNKYLNRCKYSPDGYFGSKFVTVVVTGDASGQIHFEGYQVSNQCMALVKSQILIPTHDAPELGYIRETTPEQYVPDVYYKEEDSYNNEITKIARPLPLEYLIIDIPTGFPAAHSQRRSTFNDECSVIKAPFCVENRTQIDELQDMNTFVLYLQQFLTTNTRAYEVSDILADFHLLKYLSSNEFFSLTMEQLNPLLDALCNHDLREVERWMNDDSWQTLLQLLRIDFSILLPKPFDQSSHHESEKQSSEWCCPQCTFRTRFPKRHVICALFKEILSLNFHFSHTDKSRE